MKPAAKTRLARRADGEPAIAGAGGDQDREQCAPVRPARRLDGRPEQGGGRHRARAGERRDQAKTSGVSSP